MTIIRILKLSELARDTAAVVVALRANGPDDRIVERLSDLGFVAGEPLRVVARAPFGGDPILVRIGGTRFALRRAEAARVEVDLAAAERP